MAAPRQLVSYDDLCYGESDAGASAACAPCDSPRSRPEQRDDVGGSDHDDDDDVAATHAEKWDDTDLIRAWDSNIASYRQTHAAMMEDGEYMSRQHEQESRVGQWAPVAEDVPSRKRPRTAALSAPGGPACSSIEEWALQLEAPQTEEDALHKLNMAWYYVGYYAACYQGFRSATAPAGAPAAAPDTDPEAGPGAEDL
ncbi:hypothetical protein H4R21_002560 [Coemansia helicoidea]|uniref:Uncharacterized protein n=1 Tax=Coemansia helicoidea TaxID=1286919 RepID=A0ACC1L704_9FUNG|nr:hypothetical protein H4R21_002560 [Coemansia helicoidea]